MKLSNPRLLSLHSGAVGYARSMRVPSLQSFSNQRKTIQLRLLSRSPLAFHLCSYPSPPPSRRLHRLQILPFPLCHPLHQTQSLLFTRRALHRIVLLLNYQPVPVVHHPPSPTPVHLLLLTPMRLCRSCCAHATPLRFRLRFVGQHPARR